MPGGRALVALAITLVTACATATPSNPPAATVSAAPTEMPSPPPVESGIAELARGCWRIKEPGCGEALRAVSDALAQAPAHSYGYATVEFMGCAKELCGDTIEEGDLVRVVLEPVDGSAAVEGRVERQGAVLAAIARPAEGYFPVEPGSPEAAQGVPVPVALGHCGLYSGIDADGSFWDPVGLIDPDEPATINSADGTMVITGDAAVLDAGTLHLDLVRHRGLKYLPGCM
jgi:hypothetical protein